MIGINSILLTIVTSSSLEIQTYSKVIVKLKKKKWVWFAFLLIHHIVIMIMILFLFYLPVVIWLNSLWSLSQCV